MKTLFDEEDNWNQRGIEFGNRVDEILKPLFEECLSEGFSTQQLLNIIFTQASFIAVFSNAKYQLEKKGYKL